MKNSTFKYVEVQARHKVHQRATIIWFLFGKEVLFVFSFWFIHLRTYRSARVTFDKRKLRKHAQILVVNESFGIIVPLAYLACLVVVFNGPNAANLGEDKMLWQDPTFTTLTTLTTLTAFTTLTTLTTYCFSAGNVKSDYFQWQQIDDLGIAAFNLLRLVFFDALVLVFTCIVGLFMCKINLIQVELTRHETGKEACHSFRSGFILSRSLDWSSPSIKRSYWTINSAWWKVRKQENKPSWWKVSIPIAVCCSSPDNHPVWHLMTWIDIVLQLPALLTSRSNLTGG